MRDRNLWCNMVVPSEPNVLTGSGPSVLGSSLRSREGCEALSIVIVCLEGLEGKCDNSIPLLFVYSGWDITWENQHHRIKCRWVLYALKLTLNWMKQLPWCHLCDFKSISTWSRKLYKIECQMAHKNDPCPLWWVQTVVEQQRNHNTHINHEFHK